MTTPTLLEQCGMCGSCCIDGLDEIVLKLTPPNDPVNHENDFNCLVARNSSNLPRGV